MKKRLLLSSLILCTFAFYQGDDPNKIFKTLDDDNSKFTNVGNIRLTVTNFGMYGHGFSKWPQQPNLEYPAGSGIEHIFDGGLWVGGFTSPDSNLTSKSGPFVSTGAVDAASAAARGGGFEYTNAPGSFVLERSSLLDSRVYDPNAISHQDFIMTFTDTNLTLPNGEPIENHIPLGIEVHQESYAWNFPFADFFVIFNYTIKNVTNRYLDSVYVGLWTDAVIRNTKITSPRTGTSFFNKGGNGYKDSLKIGYEFDATGDIGFTDSYLGVQFLGSSPTLQDFYILGNDTLPSVNYTSWQFRNTDDPNFFAPQDDITRFRKMQGYFSSTSRYNRGINPATLKSPSNRSFMLTSGPYRKIAPGDSINVVFALVTAKKFGTDAAALDTDEQKHNLYNNAEWALRAYYGEDRNRNGILDPGEDIDGNGQITRFILPAPPTIPNMKVVPGNNKATIYWDKRAENSIDPISGIMDFEGYRIYRTQAGFDLDRSQSDLSSLTLLAEFDSTGNQFGFNSGFSFVELSQPVTFPNDPVQYYYKIEVDNLLNGWQYLFSVTAFDKGDPNNNLTSLESSSLANIKRIFPGTTPSEDENLEIGVYPNPYYGSAYWDGPSERLRKIYFYNLPAECEIIIYTLAGDVVKKINHDQQSNGSDQRWFETYSSAGNQQMSGGEHAWDLITDNDQAIATGLYLFSVKNKRDGSIKVGKFLIVK